jgi:hypothetical protein
MSETQTKNIILSRAKSLLKKGYSVIPVNSTKQPAIPNWGKYQVQPMSLEEAEVLFKSAWGIGLLCGGKSRVVALDADMKYDLSGDTWERFKKEVPNKLLSKCLCQTTKNKGYHLIFKAPVTRLFSNEKLASRHTTAYEKHKTYMEAYDNPETRDKALNIASQDKSRVLFETRSGSEAVAKGFVLIDPSPGYKVIYGNIQELSEEEYDTIMTVARSFNEVVSQDSLPKKIREKGNWEVNPFDHYNEDGDVVQLLIDYGWEVISEYKNSIRFKRPGQTHSKSSALFDSNSRVFSCFSTSTSFDPSKSYNAAGVYAILKCENDMGKTYEELVGLGWGKLKEA